MIDRRLDELYREMLPMVYGYCRARLSQQDAEDVTAEVFTSAAACLRSDPTAQLERPWFMVATRRRVIDHWRRGARWTRRLEFVARTGDHDAESTVEEYEGRGQVVEALDALPDAQRAVLILHHVEGHPVREIAGLIGRSPRAVESLLARGRRALVAAIDGVAVDTAEEIAPGSTSEQRMSSTGRRR